MATYSIPDMAGPYLIAPALAGNLMALNDKTGKNRVLIACRDREEAEGLCQRRNDGDHDGAVRVAGP